MKKFVLTSAFTVLIGFWAAVAAFAQSLTSAQAAALFAGCQEGAGEIASAVRTGSGACSGKPCLKQWCAVVDREGALLLLKATDTGGTPQNPKGSDA